MATAALFAGGAVWGQVVNYPSGAPSLPKWSDLPDWDGMWERGGEVVWDERLPRTAPEQQPSYTDEYKAKVQAARKAQQAADQAGRGRTPFTSARAGVMPGMMTMEFPMNVEINPREVAIWSAVTGDPREIYTDGRQHPANPFPSTKGHSIGHWEGQILVVDTCCFRADTPLTNGGLHSDAMHITERIWSPSKGVLKDAITVEDPKAFTKPWSTVKTFYRRPDWEMVENDTSQNDREIPTADQHVAVTLSAAELAELEGPAGAAAATTQAAPQEAPLGKRLTAGDTEALQKATVQGGVNMAWESIVVSDVAVSQTDIKWKGGSPFTKYNCTARPDGTQAYCAK